MLVARVLELLLNFLKCPSKTVQMLGNLSWRLLILKSIVTFL